MMAGFFLMMSTSSLNGFVAATATASSLGQLAHVVSGAIGSVLGGAGGGKVLAMGAGVLAVDGQTGEMPKQQQLLRQILESKTDQVVSGAEAARKIADILDVPATVLLLTTKSAFGVLLLLNASSTADTLTLTQLVQSHLSLVCTKLDLQAQLTQAGHRQKVLSEVVLYQITASAADIKLLMPIKPVSSVDAIPLWQLDTFALSDFEISECVLKMFYDLDLVQSYRMSHETVCKFIMSVANGYRSTVQYHNWRHGFTVAHFAYSLAKLTPLQNHLLKHEICALFVAALCHDIDHRGRTNTFMANQNTSIGQLYGAVSTMEKHHLDMTNLLLSHAELDIFANASKDERAAILEHIQVVISATDLAQHFKHLKDIKHLAQHRSDYNSSDVSQRNLLTSLVTTASDLSGVVKPFPVDRSIAVHIYDEFFEQGDEEKRLGLIPQSMMDRNGAVPKEQLGFLDFVVKDVFVALTQFFPEAQPILSQLEINRAAWDSDLKKAQQQ